MIVNLIFFLIVLGLMIFFHELGHFLVAKACGVYVDRFSLGMPPRIFGIKIGETDYCVGALPIGGYVKMAGQEDAPKSEEQRESEYGHVPEHRWFNNKPVWQRFLIILAGPLMNIVLAVLLYGIVAAIGAQVPEMEIDNRIGKVMDESPASKAPLYALQDDRAAVDFNAPPDAVGWQTGDHVLSINGHKITNISDVAIDAVLSSGDTMMVKLERIHPDGTSVRYLSPVVPQLLEGEKHAKFGISPFSTALVRYPMEDRPAKRAGLQPGDIIIRANDQWIDSETFYDLVSAMPKGSSINIEVERNGTLLPPLPLEIETVGQIKGIGFYPPIHMLLDFESNAPVTIQIKDEAHAARTGLQFGDEILSINGEDISSDLLRRFENKRPQDPVTLVVHRPTPRSDVSDHQETLTLQAEFSDIIMGLTSVDETLPLTVEFITYEVAEQTRLKEKDIIKEIDGQPATVALLRDIEQHRIGKTVPVLVERPEITLGYLTLREKSTFSTEITASPIGAVGLVWDAKTVFYRVPALHVFPEAFRQTYLAIHRILRTVWLLITGDLSPKDLGGPMAIYQMTSTARQMGYLWLFKITAFISINLCIVNLLPLPLLDGSLLFYLGIEGLRRKPINIKILERIQQVGIAFIILLMLMVTYNDITRWFTGLVP